MRLKIVLVVAFVFGLSCVGMADVTTSKDMPVAKQAQKIKKQDKKMVSNVTQMMAHLSFASEAIDLKIKKAALKNLAQAKKLCAVIEKSRPKFINNYVYKFGKTTDVVENESRDYYVPVFDELSLEGQFDEKSIWNKNPKVDAQGFAIVQSTLQLNLKNIASSIDSAEKLVKADQFADAGKALSGIYQDAISSEEVVKDPVLTVSSNITLAREYLEGGKYKSAHFALKAAKSDLDKIEKGNLLKKNGAEARNLSGEIENMDKSIDKATPSMLKKMKADLKAWEIKMKSWV
jgi:ribosomal protein S20